MPELFAGVNVRYVNFNEGNSNSRKSVPQRDRSVRIRTRVDHNPIKTRRRALNRVDQLPFMIRLKTLNLDLQFTPKLNECCVDFGERRRAVQVRFALAQKIEVWAIEDKNASMLHRMESP